MLSRAGAVRPADRFDSVTEMVTAWRRALSSAAATTDPGVYDASGARSDPAGTVPPGPGVVANPYKGLRPFREADAADFHGRTALVDRLAATVADAAMVTVVGPSGSGKSSLVLAGLLPRLRDDGCIVATMQPGDDPFASLGAALALVARAAQGELVTPAALRRADGLASAVRSIGSGERLVVVVDQLEELWTACADEDRERFTAGLAEAIESGQMRVVATVRADFFDRPLADAHLGPLVSQHTVGVTPMTTTELHDAITAPAGPTGVRLDPALVSRLVAEATDQPGSLPLLQFTLAELFERRRGDTIALEAYDELGGLAGSLARRAEQIYDGLSDADRDAVRRMFTRLVTPGDGSEDTRRRVMLIDLAAVPAPVVDTFVAHRLLTTDRDRATRQPTLEVAHEVLLRSWPRLRTWLSEDRSWVRELRGVTAASRQWNDGGRDDADLYRGARLAVVDELATARPGALTTNEQEFLDRSVTEREVAQRESARRLADKVRQNRRLRRALVALGVVAATTLVAGSVAVVQRQRADHQQQVAEQQRTLAETQQAAAVDAAARATQSATQAEEAATAAQTARTGAELTTLASRSLSLRSSQRDLAALLAVEAWKRRADASSRSALFGTFTFDPGFLGYLTVPDVGNALGMAVPGTSEVLVGGFRSGGPGRPVVFTPMHLLDVVTGRPGVQLDALQPDGTDDITMTVSADGRRAALVGPTTPEGSVEVAAVFDLATGHAVGPPIQLSTYRRILALNADGSVLALQSGDLGDATVFDVASGHPIGAVPPAPDQPPHLMYDLTGGLAFGPDGRLYAGSLGTHLRVFDGRTLAPVDDITVPQYSTASVLRFSADGATVYSRGVFYDLATDGRQTGAMTRIDVASHRVIWQISGADYGYGECASFAISEATDRLWCGNYFGLIRERSLSTGARTGATLSNEKGWTTWLDVVPAAHGEILVGFDNNAPTVSRWQVAGGGPIATQLAGHRQLVGVLPDGHTLLVGSPNGHPQPFDLDYTLWDATTDAEIAGLPPMTFARVVDRFVMGAFADGTIGTFDVATGRRTAMPLPVEGGVPTQFTGSADGTLFALGYGDGHVVVGDVASGREVSRFRAVRDAGRSFSVGGLSFNPDHTRLYVAGVGLWVFDVASGRRLAHNDDPKLANVAAGSRDVVVAGYIDGRLGVFDAGSLAETRALPGAGGFVQYLALSDDATLLLAKANDSTASFYDLAAGVRLGDPLPDAYDAYCDCSGPVSLRGDGKAAALTGPRGNGDVLWDLDPEHWVRTACALAGRNLTKQEWATYVGDLGEYRATCPGAPGDAPTA